MVPDVIFAPTVNPLPQFVRQSKVVDVEPRQACLRLARLDVSFISLSAIPA
jgi:hypothetical protein